MGICLDPTSYHAVSQFAAGVPGAAMIGNLDHYAGAEREIGRALDFALGQQRDRPAENCHGYSRMA